MTSPAERLLGQTILGRKTGKRFEVSTRLGRSPHSSGGTFSIQFLGKDEDGKEVFIKATDLNILQQGERDDPVDLIAQAFLEQKHERRVLDACIDYKMDKIVTSIDYGELPDNTDGYVNFAFYIIFEPANGDSRSFLIDGKRNDIRWICETAHNISVGLYQLHTAQISHNDLKPSNVLCFQNNKSKIADLGRSITTNFTGPWDTLNYAGDRTYCPPEYWGYDYKPPMSGDRIHLKGRHQCDVYHLGSMLLFLLHESSPSTEIGCRIHPSHWPQNFGGTFEDALPHIQLAHGDYLNTIQASLAENFIGTSRIANEIFDLAVEFIDPDPKTRGHKANAARGLSQYDLQRTISKLDRLRKQAAIP